MKKEYKYTILSILAIITFFCFFLKLENMKDKESEKYFSEFDVVLEGEIYNIKQGRSGGLEIYFLKINKSNYNIYNKKDSYGRYYLQIDDEKAEIYDGLSDDVVVGDIIKLDGNLKTLIVLDSLGEIKSIKKEFKLSNFLPKH